MAVKGGMQVEVRCNEQGYKGAWVEGIVISIKGGVCNINLKKFPKRNKKSLVEVKKFIRDDEKSLVEVSLADVRPIPPHSQLPLGCLDGIAIEARETDCWWPGFIVRQILCETHKLWLVSFPHTNILTAYPLSYLRPAQEWQGGIWTLVAPEKNLNIGQVIRVMSAEKTMKSSNQSEVSQGCSTSKRIQAGNTEESSSAVCESKAIPISSSLRMSSEQLKRKEQSQHCNEAQNAKEMEVIEIEDDEVE